MANDRSASRGLSEAIAAHRAFPAMVAGWFAALFGIGTFLLPLVYLESLAAGSGLAAIVPAAAPPLGGTARSLIALLAAGAGAGLGLFLARRVVAQLKDTAGQEYAPPPASNAAGAFPVARKPISAHEELGGERLDDLLDEPAFLGSAEDSFGDAFDAPLNTRLQSKETLLASFPNLDEEDASDPWSDGWADGWILPDEDTGPGPALVADEPIEPSSPATVDEAEVVEGTPGPTVPPDESASPEPANTEAAEPMHDEPDPDAPLSELTLAQLIERFSRVLQEHARPGDTASEGPEPAPQKLADPDIRPSVSVSLGSHVHENEDEEEDAAMLDAGYSSLLSMKRPAGSRKLPSGEQLPMENATIPAPEPARDLGEEALRDALDKLQTLSKTA